MINEADEPSDARRLQIIWRKQVGEEKYRRVALVARRAGNSRRRLSAGVARFPIPAIVFQLYKTRCARTLEEATAAVIEFYLAYRPSATL